MPSKSGSAISAALKISSTWGTAVAASTGDKLLAEISHSLNESELLARAIGSGNAMITNATRGSDKPTVTITGDAQYRGAFGVVLAQFMGTAAVSAEITASQADYRHTLTFNTTLNAKYFTTAYESSAATVHEFPSCAARSVTISTPSVPGYLQWQAEAVADRLQLSTAVNTNAVLQAATLSDTEQIAVAFDDDFWINATSGATLASGDQFNVTSYELNLTRPQESANEIKGAAGNGSPIATDLFSGTLTITVKELADHTYYTYFTNETNLKCRFTVEGSQIGTGQLKSLNVYIPQMQLISAPSYSLASPGVNNVTYTFRLSKASANPSGMTSTYPYFEIVNGRSTALSS
jgi:hypothetical protein